MLLGILYLKLLAIAVPRVGVTCRRSRTGRNYEAGSSVRGRGALHSSHVVVRSRRTPDSRRRVQNLLASHTGREELRAMLRSELALLERTSHPRVLSSHEATC